MAGNGVAATRQLSFSAELRSRTRDQHERSEQVLDLPWRLTSPGDLAALLRMWGALWAEVRAGCGPVGRDESARLLVSAVRAVRQISADLDDLAVVGSVRATVRETVRERVRDRPEGAIDGTRGVRADDGSAGPELATTLHTPGGVWAVSYVLRGSRVGGTVLAPLITERLRLPAGVAADYFGDRAAGPSWVAFRRRLDSWGRVCGTTAREDAVRLAGVVFEVVRARLATALPPGGLDADADTEREDSS